MSTFKCKQHAILLARSLGLTEIVDLMAGTVIDVRDLPEPFIPVQVSDKPAAPVGAEAILTALDNVQSFRDLHVVIKAYCDQLDTISRLDVELKLRAPHTYGLRIRRGVAGTRDRLKAEAARTELEQSARAS